MTKGPWIASKSRRSRPADQPSQTKSKDPNQDPNGASRDPNEPSAKTPTSQDPHEPRAKTQSARAGSGACACYGDYVHADVSLREEGQEVLKVSKEARRCDELARAAVVGDVVGVRRRPVPVVVVVLKDQAWTPSTRRTNK